MKKHNFKIVLVVGLMISVLLLGCAHTINEMFSRENLVKEEKIKVEKISPNNVSVTKVWVYQNNDVLDVSGEARLRNRLQGGHFDVAVLDTDNKQLLKVSIDAHRPFKRNNNRKTGPRLVTFKTKLPIVPPVGSTIRVTFHKNEFSGINTYDCGGNKAIE